MRLADNVYVDGTIWPKGCRPPARIAARIGEHAWEDGDPTVAAPSLDDEPDTSEAALVVASEVNPATLDGTLMGVLDDDEPDDVTPEPAEPVPPVAGSVTEVVLGYDEGGTLPAGISTESVTAPALPEPPRVGRGASKAAWTAYAGSHGIPIPADYKLADIIAVVDATLAQRQA